MIWSERADIDDCALLESLKAQKYFTKLALSVNEVVSSQKKW